MFLLIPHSQGECRTAAAAVVGQPEAAAPSRLCATLCLSQPTSAQTVRFPAAGNGNESGLFFNESEISVDQCYTMTDQLYFTFRTSRVSRMAAH